MTTKPEHREEDHSDTFGRYVVCSTLGEGAMGRVYLAQDPVLERKVALKVITVDNRLDNKTQVEYRNRFTVEAKASAKLDHQSIVAVYDAGDKNGVPWIAFQYIEGESLESLLNRKQALELNEAVKTGLDIASALQHAHSFKIFHRDIKPANIIIDNKSGVAKLTDFGIAKAPWIELTQEGKTLGTPGYMSPEQINGFELDERTDLFSLGVILYKMISGKHPFIRDTLSNTIYATLGGEYTPLTKLNQKLPASLDSIIARCLAVKREERVQSAESFTNLLKSTFVSSQEVTQKVDVMLYKSSLNWTRRQLISVFGTLKSIKWKKIIATLLTVIIKVLQFVFIGLKILFKSMVSGIKKLGFFFSSMPAWSRRRKIIYSIAMLLIFLVIVSFWSMSLLTPEKANYTIAKTETISKTEKKQPRIDMRDIFRPKLVKECRIKIEENNIEEAKVIADELVLSRPKSAYGKILLGEISIKQANYQQAQSTFEEIKGSPRGERTIKRELPRILQRISEKCKHGKAPLTLIKLTAVTLESAENPVVKKWVTDQQYWLRWNAVNIMKSADVYIDMVNVYILDLKYAGSTRTRISAAKKLGELGDERAVPALQEAKNRGFRDPMVALTASTVLDNNFK
jgi:tRNA A-37 threonylcarbamoyl transferase component Bud32